ncbi:MAG: GDP-mannose 4,6-dehydratase [Anaerolinea sp.]|nr:GDP-mannose 4,6-dehydratase [Anaerolinea sp.]
MTDATYQTPTGFWRDRRVFVTGATGIVGAWLVKALLHAQAHVVILMRDADPQSELIRSGDIRRVSVVSGCLEDFQTLERAVNEHEVETVFHLAAQPIVGVAHRFPLHTFEANIRGSYNLLEACRVHSQLVRRVVVASSDKAYGAQPALPYTEEMPLQGQHPYEVSKSCTDLIAQSYSHTYGLPVAIARCGNIYGGGDLNWSRIVPATIRAFLREERPVIRSDGTFVRDYIYVKDVVHAYMRVAEQLDSAQVQGQAFNFSPERAITVLELVAILQRIMKCQHLPPDVRNVAEGEIHSQYLSAEKAHRTLGWQPHFSLESGLAETVEWYREFIRP